MVEVLGHIEDESADEEVYEEENDYEELKDYPATVQITDAFPSPMRPVRLLILFRRLSVVATGELHLGRFLVFVIQIIL